MNRGSKRLQLREWAIAWHTFHTYPQAQLPIPRLSDLGDKRVFVMRLADAVGVTLPAVDRLSAPAPAYPIERFDRVRAPGDSSTQRIHIIDTCQLLNKSRTFKYRQANLASLGEAIKLCRAKTTARVQLYRWLLFNGLASLLLAPPVDLKIAYETRSRPRLDADQHGSLAQDHRL